MQSYATNGSRDLITISTDRVADAVVVTVGGEVDILSGPPLRRALADALDEHDGRPVVIDITRVTLLSSTGLAVLVDVHWYACSSTADASFSSSTPTPTPSPLPYRRPASRRCSPSSPTSRRLFA